MDRTAWPMKTLGAAASLAVIRQLLMARAKETLQPVGPRWLAVALVNILKSAAEKAGVTFHDNTHEVFHGRDRVLDPARQYLVSWHPHGAFTFCAAFYTAKTAAQSTLPEAPGPQNFFVGIAELLFRFPLIGEYLVLTNCRPVGAETSKAIMKNGYTYGLQPGGLPEQVRTNHEQELVIFPPSLGFVRLAIEHGTPLLPIYVFGENQVFTTHATGRRITTWLHKKCGIAVPLVVPLPNPVAIHMLWGRPVEVGEARSHPSDEEVKSVFARYVVELQRLFDEHKDQCLPAEVARRGLILEWRGHPVEELTQLIEREKMRLANIAGAEAASRPLISSL